MDATDHAYWYVLYLVQNVVPAGGSKGTSLYYYTIASVIDTDTNSDITVSLFAMPTVLTVD